MKTIRSVQIPTISNVLIKNDPVAGNASPAAGAPSFRDTLSASDRDMLARL